MNRPSDIETDSLKNALSDIIAERLRQLDKWGIQVHEPPVWLSIISEELGEVAKVLNEAYANEAALGDDEISLDLEAYRRELIQTAACCVAAVETLELTRGE